MECVFFGVFTVRAHLLLLVEENLKKLGQCWTRQSLKAYFFSDLWWWDKKTFRRRICFWATHSSQVLQSKNRNTLLVSFHITIEPLFFPVAEVWNFSSWGEWFAQGHLSKKQSWENPHFKGNANFLCILLLLAHTFLNILPSIFRSLFLSYLRFFFLIKKLCCN